MSPAGPAGGWVCQDCDWLGSEPHAAAHAARLSHRVRHAPPPSTDLAAERRSAARRAWAILTGR